MLIIGSHEELVNLATVVADAKATIAVKILIIIPFSIKILNVF